MKSRYFKSVQHSGAPKARSAWGYDGALGTGIDYLVCLFKALGIFKTVGK